MTVCSSAISTRPAREQGIPQSSVDPAEALRQPFCSSLRTPEVSRVNSNLMRSSVCLQLPDTLLKAMDVLSRPSARLAGRRPRMTAVPFDKAG